MNNKHSKVCIKDKNGNHFNTLCSPDYTAPEIRNMRRHLDMAAKHPDLYKFLDLLTAKIVVDGEDYLDISDEQLLAELMDGVDDRVSNN